MSERMPPGCLSGQVIWGISNLDENHSATQKPPKWAQAGRYFCTSDASMTPGINECVSVWME